MMASHYACLLLILSTLPVNTAATAPPPYEKHTYIVHVDQGEAAELDRTLAGTGRRWHEAILQVVTEAVPTTEEAEPPAPPDLLYVYETALTGFSVRLTEVQAERLRLVPGVLSATADDVMLDLHTTYSARFMGLEPGMGLWGRPELVSDVVIGVVDTGIWPEHPSFGAARGVATGSSDASWGAMPPDKWRGACEEGVGFHSASCNGKIVGARAFSKGYEANTGTGINGTGPGEFRSPRDSIGHGTHTASIAAGDFVPGANLFGNANGEASGMGFSARIAAYKACWSSGCARSDVLAAVDSAVSDGVDVLSLSLGGSSRPYHSDSLAIAAFGAVSRGVFVAFSAGNSGPDAFGVTNVAPWIMTVGAGYLDRSFPVVVRLGDGREFRGASLYDGDDHSSRRKQRTSRKLLPLVYGDTDAGFGASYCAPETLSPNRVKGKIVLCDAGGGVSRVQKGEVAKQAGAAGVIVLNDVDQGEELIADAHVLPACSVGSTAAKALRDYYYQLDSAGSRRVPTARITFLGTSYGRTDAPAVAAFSSRGPSDSGPDVIKPDIIAPGVNIIAAWPPTVSPSLLKSDRRRTLFNVLSGTSMACPHVAGVAALLRAVHPSWSPAAIKSAMMTTASVVTKTGKPIPDVSSAGALADSFAMGSGHVDPERAADPGLFYDISPEEYVEYLCSLKYTAAQVVAVVRGRHVVCGKGRVVQQPGDLNYPSFSVLVRSEDVNATSVYKRIVTNVSFGRPNCRYRVKIKEPRGVAVQVQPSVLDFRKLGEKRSFRVKVVQKEGGPPSSLYPYSFGELVWVCGRYSVRSPLAVAWI